MLNGESAPRRKAGALQGVVIVLPGSLAAMGTVVLIPVLPQVLAHYASIPNSDYLVQGGLLTLPALCIALFSPLAGWLGDRLGRRRMLIAAMTVYAMVGVAPLFIDNIYAVIATRFLVGICEAVILTTSTTMICDYFAGFDREKWLAGQIGIAALSAVVLTVVAGAIGGTFGWRAPFALYALSLVLAVAAYLFTWEPESEVDCAAKDRLVQRFQWKRWLVICVVTVVGSIMFYTLQTQNGNALASLGVTDPARIGAIAGAITVGVTLGTFLFRALTRHVAVGLLIALGFFVTGGGYVAMGLTHEYRSFIGAAFGTNLGVGILMPTILVWAVDGLPFEMRARGNGLWAGTWAAGQFASALLINYLQKHVGGWLPAYLVLGQGSLAASVLAVLAFFWTRPPATSLDVSR